MAARTLPDAEYLHQCFSYDPATGELTWKRRPRSHFRTDGEHKRWNGRYANKPAGRVTPYGYMYVSIKKRPSAIHRIAWIMMTGEDPPNEIDHINRAPADNRLANLRLATPGENSSNKRMYKNNTSGFTGVVQKASPSHPRPYAARIRVSGELIWLGRFSTPEEAYAVYTKATRHYFKKFSPI
jgi:hypothetical protein